VGGESGRERVGDRERRNEREIQM
jgi:hypothetical protein